MLAVVVVARSFVFVFLTSFVSLALVWNHSSIGQKTSQEKRTCSFALAFIPCVGLYWLVFLFFFVGVGHCCSFRANHQSRLLMSKDFIFHRQLAKKVQTAICPFVCPLSIRLSGLWYVCVSSLAVG